jgi:DNA-binding HxlR family transcriptional regulator
MQLTKNCGDGAAGRSLDVLGDRWTLRILLEAFGGTRRFEEFRGGLGIARNILAGRLRALVDQGILERHLYQSRPDRYEYRLSEKGGDLYETFLALWRWGSRWVDHEGQGGTVAHGKCGRETAPAVSCPECKEPFAIDDLEAALSLPRAAEPEPD